MNILFIHPRFPGQFRHIARHLGSDPNTNVVFICSATDATLPGVKKAQFSFTPPLSDSVHPYLKSFEKSVYRGQAIWEVCHALKGQGFQPDVIVAHTGWGDALFVKEIFPDTPLLGYFEFYYQAFGADIHFYDTEEVKPDTLAQIRINNATNLLSLDAVDWGLSPTMWQRDLHPERYHDKITVLHEGVDLTQITPKKTESFTLPNGKTLHQSDEVLTYFARKLEPYRGFEEFMTAMVPVLKRRPNCQVIILGEEGTFYGRRESGDKSLKQQLLDRLDLDTDRLHFLGFVPHHQMWEILGLSSVHLYLSIPFTLSWSLIEAMAKGCVIVGSDVAPVQEVITHNDSGILVDIRNPDVLAETIVDTLANADKLGHLGRNARQTVESRYDLATILPRYRALLSDLATGKAPLV